ncbi:MAG TPA: hypothetical protein VFN76_10340 [Candidatus Limnocylindria bacterium]|nr:hypothetical protein [Candidatus Limnocylindria bacterium]
MERDQDQERDGSQVDAPTGKPPDEGLAYDPTMTDTDEANIPEESDADPKGSDKTEGGDE